MPVPQSNHIESVQAPRAGRRILCVGGWGCRRRTFDRLRSSLAAHADVVDVVEFHELVGPGEVAGPLVNPTQSVREELRRLVARSSPDLVVGWSAGALAVLELLVTEGRGRSWSAVLLAPTARFSAATDWPSGQSVASLRAMRRGLRSATGPAALLGNFYETALDLPRLEREREAALLNDSVDSLTRGLEYLAECDLRDALPPRLERVVALHGERDEIIPLAHGQLLSERCGVPLTVVTGVGHDLPNSATAEVVEAVKRLLGSTTDWAGERSTSSALVSERYQLEAHAQRAIACRLADILPVGAIPPDGRVLECGAGTGFFTERLRRLFPEAHLTAIDSSPQMVEFLRSRQARWNGPGGGTVTVQLADAREWSAGDIDLLCTACSLHWMTPLDRTLASWARLVRPGGLLAAAILTERTFGELRHCRHLVAPERPTPRLLLSPQTLRSLVQSAGFELRTAIEETTRERFSSAGDLIQHLHTLGFNRGYAARPPLTRGALREIERSYEARYRTADGGIFATYGALYLIATRR